MTLNIGGASMVRAGQSSRLEIKGVLGLLVFSSLLFSIFCSESSEAASGEEKAASLVSTANRWGSAGNIWVADFDGNGKADIAYAIGGSVYVYLSTGVDFELEEWTIPNAWGDAGYAWVADFNGDGRADIASAARGDGTVYVHLSTGVAFDSQRWAAPDTWGGSGYTWAADFNGDGKSDIASAYFGTVYMNLSTGTSFNSQSWTVSNVWGDAGYTWVADFNADGRSDIASAPRRGGMVYVHLSTGVAFDSQRWAVPDAWGGSGYTWAADFNGDGRSDIASASSGRIYMHLSTGAGFDNQTWNVPNVWGGAGYSWAADFNADGAAGVASARGGNVYMHLSTGTGFNNQTWIVPNQWGPSGNTWVGDFNGDSYYDIASASGNAFYMSLSRGGRFASEAWYSANRSAGELALATTHSPLIERTDPQITAAGGNRSLTRCEASFGVSKWMMDFDLRRHLKYDMTLSELGWAKTVAGPAEISPADDGLYIFVLQREPRGGRAGHVASLRIRRSDRPGDFGFGVWGDKRYSFRGNIPCPNANPLCVLDADESAEEPHQFVRHTQLNQGTSAVFSAGQLQIRGGKIIWVSNASGHFSPSLGSLDCVEEYLDVIHVPRAKNVKRDRTWTSWDEAKIEL